MSEVYEPLEDSFLLQKALKKKIPRLLKKNKNLTFLEIGPGSGVQLETVRDLGVDLKNIFAGDLNPDAVKRCKKLGFNCIKSNLFEKFKDKNFDVIVFNPPYLPGDGKEPPESKIITTGGVLGGEIINEFLIQAKEHLSKDGVILLLTSSLTKGINYQNFKKKKIVKEKLFFEELIVWGLRS